MKPLTSNGQLNWFFICVVLSLFGLLFWFCFVFLVFFSLFGLLFWIQMGPIRPDQPLLLRRPTRQDFCLTTLSYGSWARNPLCHVPCYTPAIRHATQPSLPWRCRCPLAPLETHTPDEGGQLLAWRPKHVRVFPDAVLSIGPLQAEVLKEAT